MELNETDFDRLRRHIHSLCGVRIQDEKKYLVVQRLESLVRNCGCEDFTAFCAYLDNKPSRELNEKIIACITTNETSFFRDLHPFDSFRNLLLPELGNRLKAAKAEGKTGGIRIWSAAASTGQEPYSLAMIISDYVRANSCLGVAANDFRILATDISDKVLTKARAGVYNQIEASRGLDPQTREKFFEKDGKNWRIKKEVSGLVDFQRLNLTESFSLLPAFDVIFCRNVLIYFDETTRNDILARFHRKLNRHGVLYLGASENLYSMDTGMFAPEQLGKTSVFRKK
jgi:chemotaxis protein methyltransferase CheR